MSKIIQISILGKVSGNVNADEVIGNRTTLKKMYSSSGEVLPFVSARAIKYAIRQEFKEKGFEIDSFMEDPKATEQLRLSDSGDPKKYIDNDLFGFMVTIGRSENQKGRAYKRHAPIAISYFKALRDTPITSEFAARFPRSSEKGSDPVPFEVEIAEFIGRLNVLIYDYIGDFTKSTTLKEKSVKPITDGDKCKRLSTFLEILLTPSYVLPRRTNSLNIPQYYGAIICMSNQGPLPIYQYLDYIDKENGIVSVNLDQLEGFIAREDIKRKIENNNVKLFFIDYNNSFSKSARESGSFNNIKIKSLSDITKEACKFLFNFNKS